MAEFTRTALFARHQPGGVFDYVSIERCFGNIFFVGSTVTGCSDTAGAGRNPDYPFATIDYAVGRCTANQGDTIYVLPGHVETLTAAGGLDLDVAGIRIVGLGWGTMQPRVNMGTAATVDVDVDAASIWVENIHFRANFADIIAAIDVNSTDFTLKNCRFTEAGANLNALIWVQDAAAAASDRMTIDGCYCLDPDAANTHFVNFAGTGDGHRVTNNILIGDWGTMAIGGAGVITNAIIANNYIWNIAAVNDSCINTAADGGFMVNNLVNSPQAQANAITAVNIAKFLNYEAVDAEDLSGLLEPIVT